MLATQDPYTRASRHLAREDAVMKRLIQRVGVPLETGSDHFVVLVRAIISQLISTSAARSVFGRVERPWDRRGSRRRHPGPGGGCLARLRSLAVPRPRRSVSLPHGSPGRSGPAATGQGLTDEEVTARNCCRCGASVRGPCRCF